MGDLGVIVEHLAHSSNKASCSGIYIGNNWVLTSGSIMADILKSEEATSLRTQLKETGFSMNNKSEPLHILLEKKFSTFQVLLSGIKDKTPEASEFYNEVHSNSSLSSLKPEKYILNGQHHLKNQVRFPQICSETPDYFTYPANVFMVIIHPGIIRALNDLMPASQGWRLMEDDEEEIEEKEGKEMDSDLEMMMVSSFVIMKLQTSDVLKKDFKNENLMDELIHQINKDLLPVTKTASKGANVYIESSPFGSLSPGVFLNSLSRGIISNICGVNHEIYLTDARCVMGTEGAPVYFGEYGIVQLCGMVISAFCWKNGVWLGLSIVAALKPVFYVILNYLFIENNKSRVNKLNNRREELLLSFPQLISSSSAEMDRKFRSSKVPSLEDAIDLIDNVVVGISCGNSWGSGVVIDTSGIILTCAHVIKNAKFHDVRIITAGGRYIPGHVIYHTNPNNIWDIAVIVTEKELPFALSLASQSPNKGSPVVVAGHGIFSPRCLGSPTLTSGVVSKIVSVNKTSLKYNNMLSDFDQSKDLVSLRCNKSDLVPILMQTSCSVHEGNSGGPVLSYHPKYGIQIVGLIVCNTRDEANNATFPHINLAIPASAIKKIISMYVSTNDAHILEYLGVECDAVSQLWSLAFDSKSKL